MADVPSTGKFPQPAAPSTTPSILNRPSTAATPLPLLRAKTAPNAKAAAATSTKGPASKFTALTVQGMCNNPSTPQPSTNAFNELRLSAETTDSEDVASDWAEANSTVNASESEAEASSRPAEGSASRAKGSLTKKVLKKRARADSDASTGSSNAAKVTKKRVRTTALQRQAPNAKTELPLGNGELANFTATIFIIQLGPNGHQFHAHESVLNRSPKFREEVHKAKSSKRATKQNLLQLMAHDPVAFEQMLQYLYKDKFQLSKTKLTALDRIAEIHELMSLAKHYVLPGLQKQVVKLFSASKILAKITPATFFDWAEDMYYEELDHENGPFKAFFARVAPPLMRRVDPAVVQEICRMVKMGGGFAEELFKATHTALIETPYVVKQEEGAMDTGSGGTSLFLPCMATGKDREVYRNPHHIL